MGILKIFDENHFNSRPFLALMIGFGHQKSYDLECWGKESHVICTNLDDIYFLTGYSLGNNMLPDIQNYKKTTTAD